MLYKWGVQGDKGCRICSSCISYMKSMVIVMLNFGRCELGLVEVDCVHREVMEAIEEAGLPLELKYLRIY